MLAKELIADPFHDEEIPAVLLQIAAQLLARTRAKTQTENLDRLLTIGEAATRLGVSKSWLYQQSQTLPFIVRQGRKISCSEQGITEYIETKMHRGRQ